MEVHLNPELQARVDRAAKDNNRGPEEYVAATRRTLC
jgi:hypothetical protein